MTRQSEVDDAAELLDAVLDLVDQINGAGFRDAHGNPIELNLATWSSWRS